MIVRELVSRLAFVVDARGADQYDARFEQTARKAESAARRVVGGFQRFAVGMAIWGEIASSIGQAVQMVGVAALAIPRAGDAMTKNINALTGALGDAQAAAGVYDSLYQGVRSLGVSLDDTVKSFGSYDLALKKNGRSTAETVDFVVGLQAAMTAFGVSGAQAASVTLQLGQALGKGKLNGDELVSLREAMPRLVDAMREALNMTDEEFAKAAEKGELTADKLIGPIFEFTRKARQDVEKLPLTMERAFAGFVTTISRFAADIDKAFRLSERIALAIRSVSDALERWRQYIPMVAALVGEMGDLQTAAISLGASLLAVFGGPVLAAARTLVAALLPLTLKLAAFAALFLLIEDFVAWTRGKDSFFRDFLGDPAEVFAPLAAMFETVKAAALAMFGDIGGQAGAAWEALRAALPTLEEAKAKFLEVRDAVVAAFQAVWPSVAAAGAGAFAGLSADGAALAAVLAGLFASVSPALRGLSADGEELGRIVRALPEAWRLFQADVAQIIAVLQEAWRAFAADLAQIAAVAREAWRLFTGDLDAFAAGVRVLAELARGVLAGAFGAVGGAIGAAFAKAREFVDWLRSNLPGAEGAGAGASSDPAGQEQRRRNFQNRMQGLYENIQPQSFTPQVGPGQMVNPVAGPVNAPQNNNITVNVPVTATGSTGAEVAAGARSGVTAGVRDMIADLGGLGRGLGVAMPRAEPAAA